MVVCPACSAELSPALTCVGCGWQGQYRDGLPVFLPETDLTDPELASLREAAEAVRAKQADVASM